MSSQTKINVDFVSTFNNKGTKQAHGEINKLTESFKRLGASFALAFSGRELIRFSKEAVSVFAADDKSAKILSQTLGNLGQSFQDVPVEDFITKLSEVNGIAKTDLRQAFDTLVRSTGDASKAQELLNVGLDVSAGTGKDLEKVAMGLAKAYAGNNASLGRLGLGLTKTQLSTNSFADNLKLITAMFSGDAAVAAGSFQGKVNRLKTSFEELKISVGQQLVDALTGAGKGDTIAPLQDGMKKLAQAVGRALAALVKLGAWMVQNIGVIKAVVAVMAGMFAAQKAMAFVKTLQIIIGVMKALRTASTLAAVAEAFATGGTNLAMGAAAIAAFGVVAIGVFDGLGTKIDDTQEKLGTLSAGVSGLAGVKAQAYFKQHPEFAPPSSKPIPEFISPELTDFNRNKADKQAIALAKQKQKEAAILLAQELATKKAKADQLALDRAQLALKLAGNTTNMANIEIEAALQRGQTRQVTDVLLLQRAEIVGNAEQANVLARKILEANGLVMDVDGSIKNLKTAKNPFGDWPQASTAAINGVKSLEDSYASLLKAIQKAAQAAADLAQKHPGGVPLVQPDTPQTPPGKQEPGPVPGGGAQPMLPVGAGSSLYNLDPANRLSGSDALGLLAATLSSQNLQQATSTATSTPSQIPGGGAQPMIPSSSNNQPIVINGITVQVSLDGTPLLSTITNAQVNQSASGTPSTFARSGYFGG